MYLELARYLAPGTDTLTDPAFEVYHGVAAIPLPDQLSEPGQTKAHLHAVVTMAYLEAQQAGILPQPGLPRPDPPTNPKVIQDALLAIDHLAVMQRTVQCLCCLHWSCQLPASVLFTLNLAWVVLVSGPGSRSMAWQQRL